MGSGRCTRTGGSSRTSRSCAARRTCCRASCAA
uniref:Uncharacterized protein n=1 Tax=Arundo donax TaxID=35708 RepID=A0A0A9F0A5_ARUDO